MLFAQQMIEHHRGALDMATAALADGSGAGPQVRDLAGRIAAAQQPEIDTMTSWLRTWGAPIPEEHPGMHAMADEEAIAAGDPSYDEKFLETMIEHHRGAVDMARTELTEGRDPAARQLAQEIDEAQTAEIDEMRVLLDAGS